LLNFYEEESAYYLVLEYCPHGNLQDFITSNYKEGKVGEYEARHLVQHILASIKVMNKNKIVHRGLKIDKFLVGENYVVKLAGFNFGKILEEGVKLQTYFVGLVEMAPEIKQGATYDKKCDIWSLGLIFYKILFGDLPFSVTKESRGDILKLVSQPDWLVFPEAPFVTTEIKFLISHMLRRDPKERVSYEELLNHPWITGASKIPQMMEISNTVCYLFNCRTLL